MNNWRFMNKRRFWYDNMHDVFRFAAIKLALNDRPLYRNATAIEYHDFFSAYMAGGEI